MSKLRRVELRNEKLVNLLPTTVRASEACRSIQWGDPGEVANKFNSQFIQFCRWTDIPNPAQIYVFLDEHPDTINDGFFMNRWEEYRWGNLPGSYHNGAANLTFADGHIETHRWVLADTRRPSEKGGLSGTSEIKDTEHADFDWLKERGSVRRN